METPQIPNKAPHILELKEGTYFWCACGKSSSQPFCDGSHKGSAFQPKKVELPEDRKVALCGCKHSSNGAFCDGSHSKL